MQLYVVDSDAQTASLSGCLRVGTLPLFGVVFEGRL